MIKPSHGTHDFTARRTFTDREGPRDRFRTALRSVQNPDGYQVHMWYGVGGQGKSALLAEFVRMVEAERELAPNRPSKLRIASATVDFGIASMRQVNEALLSLRLQLGQTAIRFPTFDTAFAQYVALTNPGASLRDRHPELFLVENEVLDDLASIAKDALDFFAETASFALPGINLAYKYGIRLTGYAREWWERRGARELDGLDKLTADALLRALPRCLGADVCAALGEKNVRVILFLDTFEALWRERALKDAGASLVDEWVRSLVAEMPGVLCIIAGRDRLQWSRIDPDWDDIINHHRLEELGEVDADAFLLHVPVLDGDVRRRMIEGAHGLPFYLELQVDLYELRRRAGSTTDVAEFGGTHAQILTRFLDHLSPDDELLLRVASYPEKLDEALLGLLCERFLGGTGMLNWGRFIHWSFIQPVADGTFRMHDLMRNALLEKEAEERRQFSAEVNNWLHRHFDPGPEGEVPPDEASGERLRLATLHANRSDPVAFGQWLWSRSWPFMAADKEHLLASAWDDVFPDLAGRLSPDDRWKMLLCYAVILRMVGRHAEACTILEPVLVEAPMALVARELAANLIRLDKFDRAKDLYHELIFAKRYREESSSGKALLNGYAKDLLGFAVACLNVNDADKTQAIPDEIEQYLVWAENASDKKSGIFPAIVGTLADYHRRTGYHDLAAHNAARAIAAWHRLELAEQDTNARYVLALNHRDLGNLDLAAAQLAAVAELSAQRNGDHHRSTLRCRQMLGTVLLQMDKTGPAREILEPTLDKLQELLPRDHSWLAEAKSLRASLERAPKAGL